METTVEFSGDFRDLGDPGGDRGVSKGSLPQCGGEDGHLIGSIQGMEEDGPYPISSAEGNRGLEDEIMADRLAVVPNKGKEIFTSPPLVFNRPSNAAVKGKSWAEAVRPKHRATDDSTKLQFIAPQVFDEKEMAYFSSELLDQGASLWRNTLVLHVVGIRPSYYRLVQFVNRVWKPKGVLEVHSRENGFYLVQFSDEEDCRRVLHEGPWFFDRRLMIMKLWSPDIKYEREVLEVIPTWIRIPGLPIQLWSSEGISRIASLVGNPLYMDEATTNRKRLAFARVFVEISSKSKINREVLIRLENGSTLTQPIEFEWLPPICDKCQFFGHLAKQCTSQQAWLPVHKGKAPAVIVEDDIIRDNSAVQFKVDSISLGDKRDSGQSSSSKFYVPEDMVDVGSGKVVGSSSCPQSHITSGVDADPVLLPSSHNRKKGGHNDTQPLLHNSFGILQQGDNDIYRMVQDPSSEGSYSQLSIRGSSDDSSVQHKEDLDPTEKSSDLPHSSVNDNHNSKFSTIYKVSPFSSRISKGRVRKKKESIMSSIDDCKLNGWNYFRQLSARQEPLNSLQMEWLAVEADHYY